MKMWGTGQSFPGTCVLVYSCPIWPVISSSTDWTVFKRLTLIHCVVDPKDRHHPVPLQGRPSCPWLPGMPSAGSFSPSAALRIDSRTRGCLAKDRLFPRYSVFSDWSRWRYQGPDTCGQHGLTLTAHLGPRTSHGGGWGCLGLSFSCPPCAHGLPPTGADPSGANPSGAP